jgi:hypothetical protein
MTRRGFIKASLAAAGISATPTLLPAVAGESAGSSREFYELRLYHLRRGPKQKLFDDFFQNAAMPAMQRAGISPIGAFTVMVGEASPTMYVLFPHKSLDTYANSIDLLASDSAYQSAGAEFINAPASDPAYIRVESCLLRAFAGVPKLEVPTGAYAAASRVFELRTYESHSKRANRKKIEMFNEGELAIFRRAGLQPVFFGETLIGSRLPNLTYMLVYEDMAARDKHWSSFVSDPEWKKLSSTPGYTDPEIVSGISNLFLRPTAYSQI